MPIFILGDVIYCAVSTFIRTGDEVVPHFLIRDQCIDNDVTVVKTELGTLINSYQYIRNVSFRFLMYVGHIPGYFGKISKRFY